MDSGYNVWAILPQGKAKSEEGFCPAQMEGAQSILALRCTTYLCQTLCQCPLTPPHLSLQ